MALRELTEGDRRIINKYSTQRGDVLRADMQTADASGGIAVPFVRLSTLAILERRGRISAAQRDAGDRFHSLFYRAQLDALKAADVSRIPAAAGGLTFDLSPSADRCRRKVSEIMTSLGGAGSRGAAAVWHVCGLEFPVQRWAAAAQVRPQVALGILIGALDVLAAHFAGRK